VSIVGNDEGAAVGADVGAEVRIALGPSVGEDAGLPVGAAVEPSGLLGAEVGTAVAAVVTSYMSYAGSNTKGVHTSAQQKH